MYKLFSERHRNPASVPDVFEYNKFSTTFRNQFYNMVEMYLFNVSDHGYGSLGINSAWESLCDEYAFEKGLKRVEYPGCSGLNNTQHAFEYYADHCNDKDFLDLLDYVITTRFAKERTFVEEINARLLQHHLGYEFINGELIKKTNTVIHETVVKPSLKLLSGREFSGAEDEYIRAWEHYKNGNKKDAILNAGKAFESAMKIICKKMGYAFDEQRDDAKKLIQILCSNKFFPRISSRI